VHSASTHPPPPPSYKDWQRRDEKFLNRFPMAEWTFLIVVFHFSIGKVAWWLLRANGNCAKTVLQAFTYQNCWPCSTFDKGATNNHLRHSNWFPNCQLKNKEAP
jgi:hypothetical protein